MEAKSKISEAESQLRPSLGAMTTNEEEAEAYYDGNGKYHKDP